MKTVKNRIKQILSKEKSISKVSKEVIRKKLTYLSKEKILNIEECISIVKREKIGGIFLEAGVALGGSSIIISTLMNKDNEFHGYDVFSMIPPPSDYDSHDSLSRYQAIKNGSSEGISGDKYYGYIENLYQKVVDNFHDFGIPVNQKNVFLHEGLFEETLGLLSKNIALAHIDCDWYEPVYFCLSITAKFLNQGGFIIIDDYHDYEGCKKAVDGFLNNTTDLEIYKNGENLILRKK